MRTRSEINENIREFGRLVLFVFCSVAVFMGPVFAMDWFFPGFGKWAAIVFFGTLGVFVAGVGAVEVYRFCRDWWTDGGRR